MGPGAQVRAHGCGAAPDLHLRPAAAHPRVRGRQGAEAPRAPRPDPRHNAAFRFVNRDNGAEHTQEFRYDERAAEYARWWVEQVHEVEDPDTAPRDFDGPGLDVVCDHCPFRTRCWPPTDPPGSAPQSILVRDDADRALALADYERGLQLESQGSRVKKLARAKLDASAPGVYGDHQLTWTGGKAKREPDVDAMVRLFHDADLPVPTTPDVTAMTMRLKTAGVAVPERTSRARTPRTIQIRPATAT